MPATDIDNATHVDPAIGERFMRARRRAGLSQAEVSKRAQVSETSVGRFEGGKQSLRIDRLLEMALVVDVSIDWLVGLLESDEIPPARSVMTPPPLRPRYPAHR